MFKALKREILKLAKFLMSLCSRETLRAVAFEFYNPDQPDEIKALSAAFGIFMGILPIWGVQTIAAIFLSVVFKLNKTIVGIFLLISFPPVMPLIIFLSFKAGSYWIGNSTDHHIIHTKQSLQNINVHFQQYIYGSITLAFTAAAVFGLLTFLFLKAVKSVKQYKLASFG